ncbi:MAG: lipopolysaccharide heptosyltransferase II [Gemmatimonadetes bacterium]|nr:lipopolysaccharide heptosyltransferase II [Gemmatimonadota bacterium]MYH18712.1 lipopolysaccharide heptosyltransferase II [Gemmatimonadota bacterium]MYK98264.1 lipopolysaccharide heptosyltransferase II [Gemmatimonadota bacterium]
MPEDPRHILVIKLRATGDVVLATPVIENLKRRFPRARLSFLAEEASADVLRWNPLLDELIVLPLRRWGSQGIRGSWREQARFYRNLRQRRFDLVFDLFGNPRSALLTWLTGAPDRVGFAFRMRRHAYTTVVTPSGRPGHEVQFHLEALEALDIPVAVDRPRVAIPGTANKKADAWLREHARDARAVIGLNPGGGWATKRWPPEFFGRLADALIDEYGVHVLILRGPGEDGLVARVTAAMRNRPLVLPETTLAELGAYLERCGLLVSNDSAPMHMAAALNVPTVGIFGPTDPRAQGPWGDGHGVVRKESVDCLGCNRTRCPIGNICMTTLEPGELLEKIRAYIPAGIVGT